jgi:hypothetical protein
MARLTTIVTAIRTGTVIALAATLAACAQPTLGYQGKNRVLATYNTPTLKTELPPEVSVEAVADAAEVTLIARGYTIERREVSGDRATVSAKQAGDGGWDRTVVRGRVTGAGTGLTVVIEPFGDEMISRAILDAILARLGR